MKSLIRYITPLFAIAALVILECVALSKGINGTVLSVVVAAVAGIGGFEAKSLFQNKLKKE